MQAHIDSLINQFDIVFYGNPWYGDGVIEKLEKLDATTVTRAPMGELHSVIQLVLHMSAWKKYLIEKMNGNDGYSIIADSEVEWPSQPSDKTWENALNELKETHDMLIEGLRNKDDEWLSILNPGTEFTFMTLVQGIIHHDVYHTGQIGIVAKLIEIDSENSR